MTNRPLLATVVILAVLGAAWPASRLQAQESLRMEGVNVSYSGISRPYAEAIGRTVAAARSIAVEKFGFDMPKTITVNVTADPAGTVRLFNDGADRFSLSVRSESDLRKPSSTGVFHLYGLCHEVGHLAMYRPIRDHGWMTGAAAEGWAHYLGSRLVDEVYAREGADLWPDRYEYLDDGMKRLESQLAASSPSATAQGAGQWKALAEIVGDRGIAPIFVSWGKAVVDPANPAMALAEPVARPFGDPRMAEWWNQAQTTLIFKRPKSTFVPGAVAAGQLAGQPDELARDDGRQAGKQSTAGGGHAVRFETPGDGYCLTSVRFHGARYGAPAAPSEDFHVWLCDEDFKAIGDFPFPYSRVKYGSFGWVTLKIKPTRVPKTFLVCIGFNPTATKGVFLNYDAESSGHSLSGLPGGGKRPFDRGDWMIRATVDRVAGEPEAADTARPSAEAIRTWVDLTGAFRVDAEYLGRDDGNVRLKKLDGAVITVPISKLSQVDREFVQTQAGRTDGGASPSGLASVTAPDLTGKPEELALDDGQAAGKKSFPMGLAVALDAPGEPCYLTSVRIHGSRYGNPRAPNEEFHVSLCDADFNLIADFPFAYSKFPYGDPKWVSLPVKPTEVPSKFVICVDFNPTRTKGVFVSHDAEGTSLAGKPGRKAGTFSGGHWLIRASVDRPNSAEEK